MTNLDELERDYIACRLIKLKRDNAARDKRFKEKLSKALVFVAILFPSLNTSFHVTGSNIYTPSMNTVSSTITPNYDYVEPVAVKPAKTAPAIRKSPYSLFALKQPRPYKSKSKYAKHIKASAKRHGVDPALLEALIKQESGFNQSARSHCGAIGLCQLMPQTAKNLGVNPYDAKQNIEGGAMYLSRQLKRFKGNKKHALAAYNAGPGAVQKYKGIPPYRETQNYVASITADYQRKGGIV